MQGLDLKKMLGLPATVRCPECGELTATFFDDYDVAGSTEDTNPEDGLWVLEVSCHECENVWLMRYRVQAEIVEEKEEPAVADEIMAKACGVPRESGKPAVVVNGKQVCPECGAPAESGYGLMGGGVGVYAFCTGDNCDWFWKMQDEDEG